MSIGFDNLNMIIDQSVPDIESSINESLNDRLHEIEDCGDSFLLDGLQLEQRNKKQEPSSKKKTITLSDTDYNILVKKVERYDKK